MENLRKTYLMVDRTTNYIKIGKSINVLYREKTLQSEKPTIEGLFYIENDIEKLLHSLFAEKRLRGEWFNLNQGDIDFIDQILIQKGLIKKEFSLDDTISAKKIKNEPQIIEKQENIVFNYISTKNRKPNTIIKIDNGFIINACYEMTALEKNIMYAVMSQIEDIDLPTRHYKVSLTDISDYTKKRVHNDDFRDAIKKLLTRTFSIKDSEGILQATFISSAYYDHKEFVEIEIDTRLRPYLFALKNNFTTFGLEVVIPLCSKYSKRLYEMLCLFRDTGLLRISVNELKNRFQLVDSNGIEQYARWSSFENNVLKTAQNEINQKADFKIDYELRKEGRKITDVDFFFRKSLSIKVQPLTQVVQPTPVAPPPLPVTELTPEQQRYNRMIERLTEFGLTPTQINTVLKKQTEQVINRALYNLTCDADIVKNKAAYLLKVFEVS